MKIAYLIGNFPVLSETFVASEIERVQQLGFDVRIFSFASPAPADIEKLSVSSRALFAHTAYIGIHEAAMSAVLNPIAMLRGARVNAALHKVSTRKANAALMLLRAAAVARRIRAAGIRHVHAHWPYASQIAHVVRAISGASYSVSIHAHEVAHENGHLPAIFPTVSFAAFCNRGAMEHLLQTLPDGARSRSHLIYHGVDLARFSLLPPPADNGAIEVLSAGRLTETKGFDRLILGCAAAREQGIDVRLTLLGRGSIEPKLRAIAREAAFSEFLDLPGWVPHEEVQRYMQRSHVFALLADTTFHDGLPNVVLEAMASGRPAILSPLPAAGEAVTDGIEGFILDGPRDIDGFVRALRALGADPQLAARMGKAARRRVESEHDASVQIGRMSELFRRYDS